MNKQKTMIITVNFFPLLSAAVAGVIYLAIKGRNQRRTQRKTTV